MNSSEWRNMFLGAFASLWENIAVYSPRIVAAFLILVFGLVAGKVIERLVFVILRKLRFDRATQAAGIAKFLESTNPSWSASKFLGALGFWFVMLMTLISASETLGFEQLTRVINLLLSYMPNIVAAIFIFVLGVWGAAFASRAVSSSAKRIGLSNADTLARLVYGALVVIVVVVGLGQLKIETDLLRQLLVVLVVAGAGAIALAFGLGAKDIAVNILSGIYARDVLKPGSEVSIDGHQGELVQVGTIFTSLLDREGELLLVANDKLTKSLTKVIDSEVTSSKN